MMNKRIIRWQIILIVGALLVLSGCGVSKKIEEVKEKLFLSEKHAGPSLSWMQFDDIPIPANFLHLPDESIVLVDGIIRTAEIKYVATSFVLIKDVINFYTEQMPLYGWQMIGTSEPKAGLRKLTFIKKHETCEVLIEKPVDKVVLIIKISAKP